MVEARPPASFPYELVDEVLDFLWDDHRTLAACSLVCKSWMKSSYYHRFERLSLSPGNSARFVALGHNNILPHVRMMMIIGELHDAKMPQVVSIVRANSAPRILILDSVNLTHNAVKLMQTLPISAVETLRLADCHLHRSTAVLDIVSAIPGLNRLIFHHAKIGQAYPASPDSSRLPIPTQLSTIEIASDNVAPYLKPLNLAASQLKLHTLNFGILHAEDARRANDIAAAYPSLQDLTITVAFLPKILPSLGLPTLTNLQSLHFIILPSDLTLMCTFILDLLWNLPSIHMKAITLKFLPIFDTKREFVTIPSRRPPALPQLEKLHVAFNFDSGGDHNWVQEMLREQFSTYHQRGILVV